MIIAFRGYANNIILVSKNRLEGTQPLVANISRLEPNVYRKMEDMELWSSEDKNLNPKGASIPIVGRWDS